jgi:hypothetical protein
VAPSPQQGNTIQSPVAQSLPINPYYERDMDLEDDVIRIAYGEVRRSVSPSVTQYIFQRENNSSSPTTNSSVGDRWTPMSILALSVNETELLQLNEENLDALNQLARNLWNIGKEEHLIYFARIEEVLLARESLSTYMNPYAFYKNRLYLATSYLWMNRKPECEALLNAVITETELLHHGNPVGNECRSLLGQLRSRAGQHDSAVDLCTQAIRSLLSTVGLSHSSTWAAHKDLSIVLRNQGKFGDGQRLMLKFYGDVYRSGSARLLLGLRASLDFCEGCIQTWTSESELQRLLKSHYVFDEALGASERHALVLSEVVAAGFGGRDSKPISEILADLESLTGITVAAVLIVWAHLANLRIEAVRPLKPSSLRQEALRVIKDLKVTKFLVPLFIFAFLKAKMNATVFKKEEQDLIDFLKNIATEPIYPTDAYIPTSSKDGGSSESASVAGEGNDIPQIDSLSGPEISPVISEAAGQSSLLKASATSQGLFNGIAKANALTSPVLVQPGFQPPRASVQIRTHASLEHVVDDTHQPVLSLNMESSFSRSLSPAQSRQLSVDDQSQHWFSPYITFSQLPSPIRELEPPNDVRAHGWSSPPFAFSQTQSPTQIHQPPNDAPSQSRFSPTMMSTPTPPFVFSLPQTPHLFHMSPSARPG